MTAVQRACRERSGKSSYSGAGLVLLNWSMTPRLPLEAARAFLFAAESGSFAGAAQRLHLSAGAISQRIQALEAFMGQTLFDRAAAGRGR